jgi:hypothetical protein
VLVCRLSSQSKSSINSFIRQYRINNAIIKLRCCVFSHQLILLLPMTGEVFCRYCALVFWDNAVFSAGGITYISNKSNLQFAVKKIVASFHSGKNVTGKPAHLILAKPRTILILATTLERVATDNKAFRTRFHLGTTKAKNHKSNAIT